MKKKILILTAAMLFSTAIVRAVTVYNQTDKTIQVSLNGSVYTLKKGANAHYEQGRNDVNAEWVYGSSFKEDISRIRYRANMAHDISYVFTCGYKFDYYGNQTGVNKRDENLIINKLYIKSNGLYSTTYENVLTDDKGHKALAVVPQDNLKAQEYLDEEYKKIIAEKGAYTNKVDSNGNTLLTLACNSNDLTRVKLLLDNGANIDQKSISAAANKPEIKKYLDLFLKNEKEIKAKEKEIEELDKKINDAKTDCNKKSWLEKPACEAFNLAPLVTSRAKLLQDKENLLK